jgi:hypothetical protein
MKKTAYIVVTCGLLVCLVLVSERPAYAYYVDPGSGLFLLQGIGSAFLGVLYVIRRKLRLVKGSKAVPSDVSKSVGKVEAQSVRDAVDRVA